MQQNCCNNLLLHAIITICCNKRQGYAIKRQGACNKKPGGMQQKDRGYVTKRQGDTIKGRGTAGVPGHRRQMNCCDKDNIKNCNKRAILVRIINTPSLNNVVDTVNNHCKQPCTIPTLQTFPMLDNFRP